MHLKKKTFSRNEIGVTPARTSNTRHIQGKKKETTSDHRRNKFKKKTGITYVPHKLNDFALLFDTKMPC